MAGTQVYRVRSRTSLQRWITFPRRSVYAETSPWCPPLDAEMHRLLDPSRNPYFRHGEAEPLIARDASGRIVGRVLAHVNHRHNVWHNERAAWFGFFECLDDDEAARLLIAAAAGFAARHGCTVLRGPVSLTIMQEVGVILDNFGERASTDATYTAPYYPKLLDAAGLRRIFPASTFRVDDVAAIDADALLGERQRALLAEGRLRVRRVNMRAKDDELETLRELINDAFSDSPFFVPFTREEYHFLVAPLVRWVDPELIYIAELDGVPCGFNLSVPDFYPLLKRMNGRSGPIASLRFLRGRAGLHEAVGTLMGTHRQLAKHGIMRILLAELVRSLQRRGYRRLTATWAADDNQGSLGSVKYLQTRPLHRMTLFEGTVPLAGKRSEPLEHAMRLA